MLRNYLLISLRNMRRHVGYTFINVMGLAAGLACVLLIAAYIRHEGSYDRFHEHADSIVRVQPKFPDFGYFSVTPITALMHFKTAYPEVVAATHVQKRPTVIRHGDKWVAEEMFAYADSSVFDVFTFPLLEGDPATALRQPNTVVLTESMAERYFGDAGRMGENLVLNDGSTLTVTGVMEDIPSNSHLQFSALASLSTIYAGLGAESAFQGNQYLRVMSPEAIKEVQAKLDALIEQGQEAVQPTFGFWIQGMTVGLYPLTRIHLYPNVGLNADPDQPSGNLYLFGAIAVFVLVLACINYMNLASARATERVKEVGIRKVVGARRRQLAVQFLGESVLVCLSALLFALMLVQVLLPTFNRLTEGAFAFRYDLPTLAVLVIVVLCTGLLAGSYPALILSRFQPVRMLRGGSLLRGNSRLRQGLVVFQFAVSVALIVATLVVHQQLGFMQSKSLGYQTEHVVQVDLSESIRGQGEALKTEIGRLAGVIQASLASGLPSGSGYFSFSEKDGRSVQVGTLSVDEDYLATMGMTLVSGRNFDLSRPSDTAAVLLSEAAAQFFEVEDRLGEPGTFDRGPYDRVVGIVGDFHSASLHQPIRPMILAPYRENRAETLVLRLEAGQMRAALVAVEQVWQRFVPNEPFAYIFADDVMADYYRAERRTGRLFTVFAGLAVLIGCLGLFGLAMFTAAQRTKEIGLRKVLGASVANIVGLLSADFLKLVSIAFIVAAPLAYLVMQRWLEDFAFRIEIGPGLFVLTGVLVLIIAITTVSYQSIKAALADPVKSLRYE